MMNKKVVHLLTAIATDARVLAEYQSDPNTTLARFGLVESDVREFTASLRAQTSVQGGFLTAASIGNPNPNPNPNPVTH